jgi:hypothetical protein
LVATASEVGAAPQAAAEQTDFDKIRRIPFLYGFGVLNSAAMTCAAGAPLALYAAELGVDKYGIGLIGGLMPFAQVLCFAFLPLVMHFGHRPIAALGYGLRFLLLIPFLAAPMFVGAPHIVFWILFGSMTAFAIGRAIAETAIWPWSQEYTPRSMRGHIGGVTALLALPAVVIVSYLVQLWLDSRTGVERFGPVFVVGILLGLTGGSLLFGLGGGRPRPGAARGLDSIRAIMAPARDRNFLTYLYSSGTQYFAYTVINLFMLLFFRDRLGMSSGKLVLLAAFVPLGGAIGSVVAGWFVDRYGTRAIRVVLQCLQIALLIALLGVNTSLPYLDVFVGAFFLLFGLIFQNATSIGSIYMLNYVPPQQKESYMALAYASDGIIGGGTTFLAGALLQFLQVHPAAPFGLPVGNYEVLFILTAVVIATSAATFAMLREEGATGVRDFLGHFRRGHPLSALWNIQLYDHLTSEERRRDLAYGFGGTRSALVKEELIAALADPSFDVRHEAIQSLGHLPNNPIVVRALESVLLHSDLIELQNAALTSLGRINAAGSGDCVARFLGHPNPLLRARATRTLGDIRDERFLPRIRELLSDDPELDCRLAAVSALGKYRDRESVEGLLAIYRQFASADKVAEPHAKVVLLALAKILGCEEIFSREWRREEKMLGSRLPTLVTGVLRRFPIAAPAGRAAHVARISSELAAGSTLEGFQALQSLRPAIEASPQADIVLKIMDGTRDVARPHRALLILLCVAMPVKT